MSKLLHRHYPLWVLMSVIFTIVTTIVLPTIAGFFTSKLKDSMRDHFTAQLNDGAARMVASGFDEAELLAVEDAFLVRMGKYVTDAERQTFHVLEKKMYDAKVSALNDVLREREEQT